MVAVSQSGMVTTRMGDARREDSAARFPKRATIYPRADRELRRARFFDDTAVRHNPSTPSRIAATAKTNQPDDPVAVIARLEVIAALPYK